MGFSKFSIGWMLVVCISWFLLAPPSPGNVTAGQAERLSLAEQKRLEGYATFSRHSLEAYERWSQPEFIERRTREILETGNMAVGARRVAEDGRAGIHRYLLTFLESLAPHGVEYLGSLKGLVAAPVAVERLVNKRFESEKTYISVDGREYPLFPLWPNGAMPSLTPQDGLTGPLVDVGRGRWSDLKGLDLEGGIALMDFSGGRNHERLFSLGASAVIVVEDDSVNRYYGERLYNNTPYPYPRFYLDRVAGQALRMLADEGKEARLQGGHLYENRPFETIFGYLPPTPEVEFEVGPSDLLEAIANDFGLSHLEVQAFNQLESPELTPGQQLRIPGQRSTYRVREGDLLQRLAVRFGISGTELLEHNGLVSNELSAGQHLRIPNAAESIGLLIPIDSVSVVPDLPHGAKVAGNLAVGLTLLEHLARNEEVIRRKGLVVAFVDGDTLGGISSRTFAEYVQLVEGEFASVREDLAEKIGSYEAADAWFEGRPIGEVAARWLGEQWLQTVMETLRVEIAVERIGLLNSLREMAPGTAKEENRNHLNARESDLAYLFDLRLKALGNRRLAWRERLDVLFGTISGDEFIERFADRGVSVPLLADRFREELDEWRLLRTFYHNNRATVTRVLGALNQDAELKNRQPRLAWHLDLSSGSPALGITDQHAGDFRMDFPTSPGGLPERYQAVVAWASLRAGWEEEWTFLKQEDRVEYPIEGLRPPAAYPEFWLSGDFAVLPIGTFNERFEILDTPLDVPEHTNFANLSIQARNFFLLMRLQLESPGDSRVQNRPNKHRLGRLRGQTAQFSMRSGVEALDPVPGAYVYYPAIKSVENLQAHNTSTYRGVRKGLVMIARKDGSFHLPVESLDLPGARNSIFAHHLDTGTGLFDKTATQGMVGTNKQRPDFQLVSDGDSEKNIVLSDVYPLVFFPGSDPSHYRTVGRDQTLVVMDAVLNGEPRHFALDNPFVSYSEPENEGTLLYMPEGSRARVLAQSGLRYHMMLVGEVDPRTGEGRGQVVGPVSETDRNLYLALTPMRIAEQMQALADYRQGTYAAFGITSRKVERALQRSNEKLEEARKAAGEKDWQKAVGASREAWGILVKTYPRILNTGREAVSSVILLMALLVPTCFFIERFSFAARGIVGQLIGIAFYFVLGLIFLNFFHPAFRIAVSPFIVMIAFTMILMSIVVLALCYQRFEVLVRRARIAGGEVEEEKISLLSSFATAFSLGVSNLKKRPTRTFLTAFTVTVLTFSIVAFVSVTGEDRVVERNVPLDNTVEGQPIEAMRPRYEGVLFRNINWRELEDNFVSAVESEFGSRYDYTMRGYYIEWEGGGRVGREGANQIAVNWKGREHIINGIVTFEPDEVRFSGIHEAVSRHQWFRSGDPVHGVSQDRYTVILPDSAAQALGIKEEDLFVDGELRSEEELPLVRMRNHRWRVIGILYTDKANRIRDINARSLAIVDYQRTGITRWFTGDIVNEPPTATHMDWNRMAIVPMAAARDVDAMPRSLAIRFDDREQMDQFFQDAALRLNRAFFAHADGDVSLITPREVKGISGLAKIIVPVILCILIVSNTMTGTVEERKGEVGMLGAVGLSPRHISFLLVSESLVFSIIGIVFGLFSGLFFANLIPWLTNRDIDIFSALSFNFTALASMGLALGTGVVVLLATLMPAKKAATLAAPSGMERWELPDPGAMNVIRLTLPFTLTRGNALGMAVFFRQFLLNHTDSGSDDFNCRSVVMEQVSVGEMPSLTLSCDMWLAPYDLDVSQRFRMNVVSTEESGIYAVTLHLDRITGTKESWMRTNYQFLNLVRLQFLIWRNLTPEARISFINTGGRYISASEGDVASPGAETVHS